MRTAEAPRCAPAVPVYLLGFAVQNHPASTVKVVISLRHQAVRPVHIVAAVMDDLAGGTHIVVVAIDLDQTGIITFAVPIEVQASIFLIDSILQRCDLTGQLAICVEVIFALRQQIMCPGNVVIAIAYHFTLGIHIVIVIANFDEARIGQFSIDVVMQNTIFLDDAILRSAGQLSVLIEKEEPLYLMLYFSFSTSGPV